MEQTNPTSWFLDMIVGMPPNLFDRIPPVYIRFIAQAIQAHKATGQVPVGALTAQKILGKLSYFFKRIPSEPFDNISCALLDAK